MIKVNIYLTKQQRDKLRNLAEKTGLKVSEIIRRAIDEYLENRYDTSIQN